MKKYRIRPFSIAWYVKYVGASILGVAVLTAMVAFMFCLNTIMN